MLATHTDATVIEDLRKLRVYHWKRALVASAARIKYEKALKKCREFDDYNKRYYTACIGTANKAWALHMGFVQALNELFDTSKGDTAERDVERGIDG